MNKMATISNASIEFELDEDGEGDDAEEEDIRDDASNDENVKMFDLDDEDDF